jgi:hypothetical protein
MTYSQAETFCQNFELNLYDVSLPEVQTALFKHANTLYQGPSANLHVKGQVSNQCQRISKSTGVFGVKLGNCNDLLDAFCGYPN